MQRESYILTFACDDKPGIVAKVTSHILVSGGNILESHQYNDIGTNRFFMRTVFNFDAGDGFVALATGFEGIAAHYTMTYRFRVRSVRPKVLILASKADHCLADLLYRQRIGELDMDVTGIVSNHPRETFAGLDFGTISFRHLPAIDGSKAEQEAEIWRLFQETGSELMVLARYMQVLSDDLAGKLGGRCINIHHSFLPGFKGARPYTQAHQRGVKVIGATAHYVTAELDEGPIIEQDVERISHSDTPDDLIRKGRDIERRVLARAIGFHLDGRVLVNGPRTVVFRD